MNALVSALITAAVPWPVITSSGGGATTAQRKPATTPRSTVPAATVRQATMPRRTPAAARAAGTGIGSVILRSSVRDRRRPPRACPRHAAAPARHGQAPRAGRKIGGAQLLDTLGCGVRRNHVGQAVSRGNDD